jgi:TolB-like protein/Tfp pilus assembly protein PilF
LIAQKLNRIEKFWKELKRRKVVHVITVYAATAFVILELVNMIARPLKLPEWTEAFVIVLLCIGFVIAVLLSWIYDITPTGVRKTKPVSKLKHSDPTTHAVSSRWKIASYVSGVVIIALVAFNFISRRNLNADISKLEKSIAVLPFRNESPDTANAYFINGIMERITTNLQMVKEFRVVSRTSVEQYRNTTKSIAEIAKEQDVNFIVEGSGQKVGNLISITTQLIKARGKETHLWAKTYDEEIKEVNDYFRMQGEIAQLIASGLRTTITPEEKQLIEKTPTSSLAADDFYQRGREELTKYEVDNRNKKALQKAEDSFHNALKYDPNFAQAFTGLASVYWNKHFWNDYFSDNFMDSILVFTNKALSIDDQLSDAYILRGNYYYAKGLTDKAVKEYDIALKYNPNDYHAYIQKAFISLALKDYVATFDNGYKAINRYHGTMLPVYLRYLAQLYLDLGFIDKAKYYYEEACMLDGDSATYFKNLENIEWSHENFGAAGKWREKAFETDSIYDYDNLVELNIEGRNQEAFLLAVKEIEQIKETGALPLYHSHRIGYAFQKIGKLKEADYYFKEQIRYCTESIKLGRAYANSKAAQYDLAATYAFLGYKEKAYQNLSELSKLNFFPKWWITLIKYDPLFDSIKSEERFKRIIQNMEAKYQAEHERVRKWLEEQGML